MESLRVLLFFSSNLKAFVSSLHSSSRSIVPYNRGEPPERVREIRSAYRSSSRDVSSRKAAERFRVRVLRCRGGSQERHGRNAREVPGWQSDLCRGCKTKAWTLKDRAQVPSEVPSSFPDASKTGYSEKPGEPFEIT